MEPRRKGNKIILAAKTILFHFRRGSKIEHWNILNLKKNNFISFHDGTTTEIKKIGRSTDGGGWDMKFFKIIVF